MKRIGMQIVCAAGSTLLLNNPHIDQYAELQSPQGSGFEIIKAASRDSSRIRYPAGFKWVPKREKPQVYV